MNILIFLILFPLIISLILLLIKPNIFQKIIVALSCVVICSASIYLIFINKGNLNSFFNLDFFNYNILNIYSFNIESVNKIMLGIEIIIALIILILSVIHKKPIVFILAIIQTSIIVVFEVLAGHEIHIENHIFVDNFSIIMALIIGIIGSLICVYALGYMKDFHLQHKEVKDRRRFFFFVLFLFLSAMFGIVFSNSLLWIYFFWEITTICSFLLIGYKKDKESTNNAFRALAMNLLGGLGFACAIIYMFYSNKVMELDKMLVLGKGVVLIPAVLIGFAGLTKSAQMPFSSWLTGAMVAPTPVSALLHSSTMVKAGVYIIIKLAPIFQGTIAGFILALIGAVTFLITSFIAVSQNNAKKILAYSTIANLGLVVACGGIGTNEAVWSGILLIIFHAVAKSLLFLGVGAIEHKTHSKDVENMDCLISRMPKLTIMMVIGISGMFLAPFGMLISKWATLKAFVDVNPILAVILAFGSATTLFFWTKWLGKIISVKNGENKIEEKGIDFSQWSVLFILAFLTVIVCCAFPIISKKFIEPYVTSFYGTCLTLGIGNIIIMLSIMLSLAIILPIGLIYYLYIKKNYKKTDIYLAGANLGQSSFTGSMGKKQDVVIQNYYMDSFFNEKKLFIIGVVITVTLLLFMIGGVFLW